MRSLGRIQLRSDHSRPGGRRDLDLDVVRGLAILLAMGWHFNSQDTGWPVLEVLLTPGRRVGWAGVDLFFVLSGFLVGSLALREVSRKGNFDSRRFVIRRALKLWPVLYIFLFAQVLLSDHPWQTFLFQNSFHVQNYTGSSLDHLWSLAVEEHFYLALAILYPLAVRRRLQPRTLVRLLVGVMATALILRLIAVIAGFNSVTIQHQTQFRADALACGVLLAVIATYYPAYFARLLRLRWVWLIVVIMSAVFLMEVPKQSAVGAVLCFTVSYVCGAALILLVRHNDLVERANWLLRPVGTLGVYSYALYIWHLSAARVLVLCV